MDLKLHANVTTTPRTRAYIQNSQASNAALARELGIHSRTVARWKTRRQIVDRSTRPHRLTTASPARFGRRSMAWSSASTAASVTTSTACRRTAPPTTAGFSTMPNAMPISTPLSPITIAPACDASAITHPPNSSLISRDTTCAGAGSRARAAHRPWSRAGGGPGTVPASPTPTDRQTRSRVAAGRRSCGECRGSPGRGGCAGI